MKAICKNCHYWERGDEKQIPYNGKTIFKQNEMGICFTDPQEVETQDCCPACRHFRAIGT